MASVRFDIRGVNTVTRSLRDLPRAFQRRAAEEAVRAGVRPALQAARRFAPRDSGVLRRSIRARRLRTRPGELAIRRVDWGRAFYGRFQESGWFAGGKRRASSSRAYSGVPSFRGRFGVGNRLTVGDKVKAGIRDRRRRLAEPRFIPGYQYLRRAAVASEQEVTRAVSEVLQESLRRAWSGR